MVLDWSLLWAALGAAATAFLYAIVTYLSKTNEEDWRLWKALQTAILAGTVGLLMVFFGWSADVITASPMYAFLGIMLERMLKYLQKRYIPALPLLR